MCSWRRFVWNYDRLLERWQVHSLERTLCGTHYVLRHDRQVPIASCVLLPFARKLVLNSSRAWYPEKCAEYASTFLGYEGPASIRNEREPSSGTKWPAFNPIDRRVVLQRRSHDHWWVYDLLLCRLPDNKRRFAELDHACHETAQVLRENLERVGWNDCEPLDRISSIFRSG